MPSELALVVGLFCGGLLGFALGWRACWHYVSEFFYVCASGLTAAGLEIVISEYLDEMP